MTLLTEPEASANAALQAAQLARKAAIEAYTAKLLGAGETPAPTVSSGDLLLGVDAQTGADIYIPVMSVQSGGPAGATGPTGPAGPAGAWTQITQAAYDALSPPNSGTLYVIVG